MKELKSLIQFYNILAEEGKVPLYGWENKKISKEICLREDGSVAQVVDIKVPDQKNNFEPQIMVVPYWGSNSTNKILSTLLHGTSAYMFGMSTSKKDPERVPRKFADAVTKHHEVLDNVHVPEAIALLRYFDRVKEKTAFSDSTLKALEADKGALSGEVYVFSVNGRKVLDVPEIRAAWDEYYDDYCGKDKDGTPLKKAYSLIDGKLVTHARVHPSIKHMLGTQSSGGSLSSFNAESFESFGLGQGLNAPMSARDAFAYAQALIYILREGSPYYHAFGPELTIAWWPLQKEEETTDSLVNGIISKGGSGNNVWSDADLQKVLQDIARGLPVPNIDTSRQYCVMGLTGNSGRIAVRFFYKNSFGHIVENINNHYDRLELDGSIFPLTLRRVEMALTRDASKPKTDEKKKGKGKADKGIDPEKEISKPFISNYMQAVLFDKPYPREMFVSALRRISVGTDMDKLPQRAALVKAYCLQNLNINDSRRENFTMALNNENTNTGYLLGRLLATYEIAHNTALQKKPWELSALHAMYSSAMNSPAVAFPTLSKRIEVHMQKKECTDYQKLSEEILDKIEAYPARLNLSDQGAFTIGYYHQRKRILDIIKERAEKTKQNETNQEPNQEIEIETEPATNPEQEAAA